MDPLSRLAGMKPEVGLLDRTIILFSVFSGTAMLISTFYIATNGARRFQFLCILNNLFSGFFLICIINILIGMRCVLFLLEYAGFLL